MKNKNLINSLAFFALAILALLIVVNNLLPILGITIKGVIFSLLATIKDLLILIILGLTAYSFVENKSKNYLIAYWVFVGIFVLGMLLVWF